MTSKPPAPEAFLTTEEVLEYLQVNLRTVYRLIKSSEYDVETAVDGSGALDALQRAGASYDLMMSDLIMPGMDGLSLIRAVKGFRPELPIIIITGYSSTGSAIAAVNLRVAGYLTKPLRDTEVLQAAAKALGPAA